MHRQPFRGSITTFFPEINGLTRGRSTPRLAGQLSFQNRAGFLLWRTEVMSWRRRPAHHPAETDRRLREQAPVDLRLPEDAGSAGSRSRWISRRALFAETLSPSSGAVNRCPRRLANGLRITEFPCDLSPFHPNVFVVSVLSETCSRTRAGCLPHSSPPSSSRSRHGRQPTPEQSRNRFMRTRRGTLERAKVVRKRADRALPSRAILIASYPLPVVRYRSC